MTLLILYARLTAEDGWEREGPVMAFSDDAHATGREKAAANGSAWVDHDPELRSYEVVG